MIEEDLVYETEQKLLGYRVIFDRSTLHQRALRALGPFRRAFEHEYANTGEARADEYLRSVNWKQDVLRLVIDFLMRYEPKGKNGQPSLDKNGNSIAQQLRAKAKYLERRKQRQWAKEHPRVGALSNEVMCVFEAFNAGFEHAVKKLEQHCCVSTCCDAQPGARTAEELAKCLRKNRDVGRTT